MRSARLLALALLAAGALLARAADAPHEDGLFCSNCHMGHNAPGGSLTKMAGNFTLCQSCHQNSTNFGFDKWSIPSQAVPGVSGHSHRWDATATNMGATPPSTASSDPDEVAMAKRLDEGKLMCSTCHDQHEGDYPVLTGRGRQTISAVDTVATGTGALAVGTVASDATAKRYLVEVVAAGSESTARFRLSNDNRKSWFGCTTPLAYDYVAWSDTTPNGCLAGGAVPLNDAGGKVKVAFGSGSYVVGDAFKFYVSYPFLRADITNSRMCLTCHRDRNMSSLNVQGIGTGIVLGSTVFHHPVGEALATTPLDANGVSQAGAGDGNASNDLSLGSGGVVSCLTCHRVHNADSNSLTPDP